jgi:uncharacterized membrane protein YebE (DUF533 family)
MAQAKFQPAQVSASKFTMLRCLVAMAHADGVVTDEERAYVSALANRMSLTNEQRTTLERDLVHAQDVGDLFRHINDPNYRSQVLYFARLMAFKDGILHPSEQEMLDKLHALATDGLDMSAIRAEVQRVVETKMAQHDIVIDHNRPKKGEHFIPWMQWLDEILLRLGIDLLRD